MVLDPPSFKVMVMDSATYTDEEIVKAFGDCEINNAGAELEDVINTIKTWRSVALWEEISRKYPLFRSYVQVVNSR